MCRHGPSEKNRAGCGLAPARPINMSVPPKLTELLDNLEDLPSDEVRYMCAKLGVDQSTLDKVDADHRDALTRIPKYLQAWLDRDSRASWTGIVEILKSKRLNKRVLADKIMKQYCPTPSVCSGGAAAAVLPASNPRSSASCSSHKSSPSSDSSSLEFELQPATNEGAPSDQKVSSPPTLPAAVPESKSKPERRMFKRHIPKTASDLEMKFFSVVSSANDYLTETLVPKKLQALKTRLIRLSLSGRYKKLHFLQEKKEDIRNAQNVGDIFDILDHYWNYVDYSLLEYIVKTYCNGNVKREMKKYKRDLKKFEKATSVKDFTLALPNDRKFPSELSTLCAELKIDAAECTLHHVRKIKKALAQKASLQPYVVYMQDLHASSVVVTFAFPRAARDAVERALDKKFLKKFSIVPESVCIDGVIPLPALLSREPDVSQVLHSSAMMPDPPHNVREEVRNTVCHHCNFKSLLIQLTYSIRRCDLKQVYRGCGTLLMRHCKEIESETKTLIQCHWGSEMVDFHIAGLEEDVTRARLLIREEFEVCYSNML